MYSSRRFWAIALLATVWPDLVEAQTADQPAKPAAENGLEQPPIGWDEQLERIIAARAPRSVDDLRRIQKQVAAVVRHARPAVVAVQIGDAIGSGVIISPDGLVLTAGHVAMEPGGRVFFRFPDGAKRARGRSLGVNRTIDSGMMQITDKPPGGGEWPHVKMADSGSLRLGEWVVALGQPNGYLPGRAPPVRLGRVLDQSDDVIRTDCTLVGGDSGGPLFNLRGEVVGIHSRIARPITENYHVPISTYHGTWDRLLAGELWGDGIAPAEQVQARPWLGLTCNRAADDCRVEEVFADSPAAAGGIQAGDIITHFDGEKTGSFGRLAELVLSSRPNKKVTITIDRDGKSLDLEIRLGQMQPNFPGAAPRPTDSRKRPASAGERP